ncbi:hypothetical protein LCGC14_2164890, partial [marine sediment metagenome]
MRIQKQPGPGGGMAPGFAGVKTVAQFTYDALGRRIRLTEWNSSLFWEQLVRDVLY